MHYSSIFQQLFNFIPRHRFEKSVEKLSGDRYCKHFTAWRQFLTCLYAQITGKDSLREIENGLLANHNRLYHLGMEVVSKSTLSEAMNRRDPEIFKALFEEILDGALKCAPRHKFRFHNPLYAIDNLLVAYIKFLHGFKLSLTELTNRIRDTLMQNLSLLEILALDRKTISKPPDWNSPEQLELFNEFLC